MKVRQGSDICLLVIINSLKYQVFIQSVKVYLINKTLKKQLELPDRFPIEPFSKHYLSTSYNINGCGPYRYNCYPVLHKYSWGEDPNSTALLYTALVSRTQYEDLVKVYFPAEAQKAPGDYAMMVVAQVFHHGYPDNLKTITLYYDEAFTLIARDSTDTEDYTGSETIRYIDQSDDSESPFAAKDRYVTGGSYEGDNNIRLDLSTGETSNVDVEKITGWWVEGS